MTRKSETVIISIAATKLNEIFAGNEKFHATFSADPSKWASVDGKVKPDYHVVDQPVTAALWQRHIRGDYPLVIPLERENGTTKVTGVDIDHAVDLIELTGAIERSGLPLFIRKSKTRGHAHVYGFHDKLITVAESEKIAAGMARLLNITGKIEIFPRKQRDPDKRRVQLNMPFWGGDPNSGIIRPGSKVADPMVAEEFWTKVRFLSADHRAALISEPAKSMALSDDRCRDWAGAKLKRYVSELRNAVSDGNNLLTKHAYHLGMMIGRSWLKEGDVRAQLAAAISKWSRLDHHHETLDRSLRDGQSNPHPDITEDEDALTEDGVALEFAYQHADDLRFDHDAGKWFRWDGTHWRRDRTQFAFAETRNLVRELARDQSSRVRNIASKANFAGNVERLARADQALAVTQDIWDRDPYLLGTPGGVVDLRTGDLRQPSPLDFISKLTAVAPSEKTDCPQWLQFLSEATSGDTELQDFLQVLLGYGLTGETREHILPFVHGDGGNGKGVFLNTVRGIFADYAVESAPDMFMASTFDRHPTDIADLRGARLVTSSDTSTGKTWDDDKIKRLTGGDKVKGRFMRQDFFEFWPQFLLLFVGNEPPALRSVSAAMRRRLVMVPFVYKPKTPDTRLTEKLRAEWPGILRWMIEGCLRWQRDGIVRPEVVSADTETYFSEQDIFRQWFDASVQRVEADSAEMQDTHLFASWERFAAQAGVQQAGDKRWFNAKLRGDPYSLTSRKSNGQTLFRRVALKRAAQPAPGDRDGRLLP